MSSIRCIQPIVVAFQTKESIMAEHYFKILAEDMGVHIVKSTSHQDRTEKWDYEILYDGQSLKVDVKCMKKLSRTDAHSQDKLLWIELDRIKTNSPPIGWLYSGKADVIAFECSNDFILVTKSDLIKLVEKKINRQITTPDSKKALNKLYIRKRPKKKFDTLTLIKTSDARKIAYCIWDKTALMKPANPFACEHLVKINNADTNIISKFFNKLKRKRPDDEVQFNYCPKCGIKFC